MMPGAVICVKCGYDSRIRGRRSVEHVDENNAPPKRSKLGHMGSLLRGTFFSFLGRDARCDHLGRACVPH